MKTSAQFFEDFNAAGFLVPASWTPSPDAIAAGATAGIKLTNVRYREMDEDFLDGMVVGAFPSIMYPTAGLPGLIEGEAIAITPPEQTAQTFRVRAVPRRGLDGTVCKAFLKKVS